MEGARSDSDRVLRRVIFWHWGSSGAIAPARCRKTGSGGCAMKVLEWVHIIRSGTVVVRNDLPRHAWPDRITSWW